MSADRVVVVGCLMGAAFVAGMMTQAAANDVDRMARERERSLQDILSRAPRPVGVEMMIGCPVTPARIEEYYRVCRARTRAEATK